jgi:hypothetical protein
VPQGTARSAYDDVAVATRICRGEPEETDIETTTCVPGRLLSAWMRTDAPAASESVTGATCGVVGVHGAEKRSVSVPEQVSATSSQEPLQMAKLAVTFVLLPFVTFTLKVIPTRSVVPKFTTLK